MFGQAAFPPPRLQRPAERLGVYLNSYIDRLIDTVGYSHGHGLCLIHPPEHYTSATKPASLSSSITFRASSAGTPDTYSLSRIHGSRPSAAA